MSDKVKFRTQIEIVDSEEVKFDGNETWNKHEAYLHDPDKKYPSYNDIYNKDKLEPGFYDIEVEMFVQKGKVQLRKQYVKAEQDKGFNAPPVQKPVEKKAA